MPLNSIDSDALRAHCKRVIENLERWFRRLIDDELSKVQSDYLNLMNAGSPVFKKSIREDLPAKASANRSRFPRPIDAATLEDEIAIITNDMIYQRHFGDAMRNAFPEGREECRTFLSRLIEPRNQLYHANTISTRQAEQVICYANDVIDSIKAFYVSQNREQDFDVPSIIEVRDGFGRTFSGSSLMRDTSGIILVGWKPDPHEPGGLLMASVEEPKVRPGDTVSFEVVVDPSFPPDSYTVSWRAEFEDWGEGLKVSRLIEPRHVKQLFRIYCSVTSKEEWHRYKHHDDSVGIHITVLPPLR